MLFDEPGVLGDGGNSGFQAVNLVAQHGPRGILLVGFDMIQVGHLVHWHGRHGGGRPNPDSVRFARWRRGLDDAAPTLASMGIEVMNASADSALTRYAKVTIDEAMEKWKL